MKPEGQSVWKRYDFVDGHESNRSPYKATEKHLHRHGHDNGPGTGESSSLELGFL